ncbi:MAG: 6-carboxytetrahydropterin synthase [Syntrophobacteraceae bacterium]
MPGMFEVFVKTDFSAAHSIRGYPGNCVRVHGHNWTVEVYAQCRELNDLGIAVDFRDIRLALKDVLAGMDHYDLNELPAFKDVNPTSENVARFLYHELSGLINTDRVRISRIKVSEAQGAAASYWED